MAAPIANVGQGGQFQAAAVQPALQAPVSVTEIRKRLSFILQKPLRQRCQELEKFHEYTSKDLHAVLPEILETIFDQGSNRFWGLHTLNASSYQKEDFNCLRYFMSPEGALVKIINKLQLDSFLRYEFPVACLPATTRYAIYEGAIPAFYANKINFQAHGRQNATLSLSAFEFYMFQFAYFVVGIQDSNNWTDVEHSLYPCILQDYLNHYLPLTAAGPAPTTQEQQPPHTPSKHSQSISMGGKRGIASRFQSLLPGGAPQPGTGPDSALAPPAGVNVTHDPWRSEVLAYTLAEFWLGQAAVAENKEHSFAQQLSESYLPSLDLIRVVRLLVKHLHYFSNSLDSFPVTPTTSLYQHSPETPINKLKSSIIPQIFKKKLYIFVRHGFSKWPLDSSFRTLLETWLSYIQPWRYTGKELNTVAKGSYSSNALDKDHGERSVEEKWQPFVRDNLLFYSKIFEEFVQRAFRMDLTSPKNALLLFRVAKVLGQKNLDHMIEEAESSLLEHSGHHHQQHQQRYSPTSSKGGGGSLYSNSGYLLSPPPPQPAVLSLQPEFVEFEGAHFVYQPLFSEATKAAVSQLLKMAGGARARVRGMHRTIDQQACSGSLWAAFRQMLDQQPRDGADLSLADLKKAESHLEQSLNYLSKTFKVALPPEVDESAIFGPNSSLYQGNGFGPDVQNGILTPLGKYQMKNNLCKADIRYQGDPELQPIRTYESRPLVKTLYRLSTHINSKYGNKMAEMHQRRDLIGRLSRQYLLAPVVISHDTQQQKDVRLGPHSHRPRLSLRCLGSIPNLGYLAAYFVVLHLANVNLLVAILLLLLFVLLYGLYGAFLKPAFGKKEEKRD